MRLVTHLPLIVPENCGFRVGNDTRQWVPGKAWVFDDTIEHEAWNDSDKLRVVLIFDIWHPHLTPPERAMITATQSGSRVSHAGHVQSGARATGGPPQRRRPDSFRIDQKKRRALRLAVESCCVGVVGTYWIRTSR